MTDEEINGLVINIQDTLVKNLHINIEEVRRISYKQLNAEIKNLCNSDFTKLLNAIEKLGKIIISCYFNKYGFNNKEDKEDVWQSFVMDNLPKVIRDFIESKGSFRPFLNTCIINFCRTWKGKKSNNGYESGEEETIPSPYPEPGKRYSRMTDLKTCIDYLDSLKTRPDKKLLYHCRDILGNFGYDNDLLRRCKGKTLSKVSGIIEGIYTKIYEEKTEFMNTINRHMKRKGVSGNEFLENVDLDTIDGRQDINEMLKDVRNAIYNRNNLGKYTDRIGINHIELLEE
jgi:hypothetical protein